LHLGGAGTLLQELTNVNVSLSVKGPALKSMTQNKKIIMQTLNPFSGLFLRQLNYVVFVVVCTTKFKTVSDSCHEADGKKYLKNKRFFCN
jgi:hypothetical protein